MKQMEVSGGNAESHEDDKNKVETILAKISFIKHTIAEKLGLSGKELNQATDEALVDAAADAIARADEGSGRTENTPQSSASTDGELFFMLTTRRLFLFVGAVFANFAIEVCVSNNEGRYESENTSNTSIRKRGV